MRSHVLLNINLLVSCLGQLFRTTANFVEVIMSISCLEITDSTVFISTEVKHLTKPESDVQLT